MLSLTHLFFWNAELLNSYSFFKVHMLFFPGSLSSSSSSPDRSPPCHLPTWPSHHVACVFRSSPTTGLSMCYLVDDGYLEGKPPGLVYLASLRHWYILKYSAFWHMCINLIRYFTLLVSMYYHEILGSYIKYLKIMTLTSDIKKKNKILPTQSYVLVPDDQTTTTTTKKKNRQTNMFLNPPKKKLL